MKEDLIKLREQLHNQYKKYVIVQENNIGQLEICGEELSLEEIENLENTDEVIASMEELMKKGIEGFYKNNIDIASIGISSSLGLICTKNLIEALNKKEGYEYDEMLSEYWLNSKKFIPVRFTINDALCGTESLENAEYNYGALPTGKCDLFSSHASGIVDYDKFIVKLRELGYNIELLEYEDHDISNFNQLKSCLVDATRNNKVSQFDLEVNLIKEKESNQKTKTK